MADGACRTLRPPHSTRAPTSTGGAPFNASWVSCSTFCSRAPPSVGQGTEKSHAPPPCSASPWIRDRSASPIPRANTRETHPSAGPGVHLWRTSSKTDSLSDTSPSVSTTTLRITSKLVGVGRRARRRLPNGLVGEGHRRIVRKGLRSSVPPMLASSSLAHSAASFIVSAVYSLLRGNSERKVEPNITTLKKQPRGSPRRNSCSAVFACPIRVPDMLPLQSTTKTISIAAVADPSPMPLQEGRNVTKAAVGRGEAAWASVPMPSGGAGAAASVNLWGGGTLSRFSSWPPGMTSAGPRLKGIKAARARGMGSVTQWRVVEGSIVISIPRVGSATEPSTENLAVVCVSRSTCSPAGWLGDRSWRYGEAT
eukprot:RCo052201